MVDDMEKSKKPENIATDDTELLAAADIPEAALENNLEPSETVPNVPNKNVTSEDAAPPEAASPEGDETVSVTEPEASEDTLVEDNRLEDGADLKPLDEVPGDFMEDRAEVAPEQVESAPIVTPPPPATQQGSRFWPMVFGGLIAACLGFFAGRGDQLDEYLPISLQRPAVDLTGIEAQAAALAEADSEQAARLGALQADLEALTAPDPGAIHGLEDSLAAARSSLSAIVARLEALEARPVLDGNAPAVASADDLEELETALAVLQAQAIEDEARAKTEAERTLARAALTQVVTAVDNGQSFAGALDDLVQVTPVAVPEVLRALAQEGVPTLSALVEGFPEAARAGLAAARSEVPESEVQSIGGFLRRQLSVRSVVPREGSGADAVLSRTEAALKSGDLSGALGEAETLPDAVKVAMQDWLTAARARQDAKDAANRLADSLKVN